MKTVNIKLRVIKPSAHEMRTSKTYVIERFKGKEKFGKSYYYTDYCDAMEHIGWLEEFYAAVGVKLGEIAV